jgi:hypothetical protein
VRELHEVLAQGWSSASKASADYAALCDEAALTMMHKLAVTMPRPYDTDLLVPGLPVGREHEGMNSTCGVCRLDAASVPPLPLSLRVLPAEASSSCV